MAAPKRKMIMPTDSLSFFRAQAKYRKGFGFTAEGNLKVPPMEDQPETVIELPNYRNATIQEQIDDEERLRERLRAVEKEYDETALLLKEAIASWRLTGATSGVLRYQDEMRRLDAERTMLRSPVRWIKTYKSVDTNQLLLDEIYETRKYQYPVSALVMRSLPFQQTVRVGTLEQAPVSQTSFTESQEPKEQEYFTVFYDPSDPEHGLLSPNTMVEFIFNSTKYNSLAQAYEVERVTALGRKDIRPLLLKTRSPETVKKVGSRIVGDVEKPRELWISILKSLVSQYPNYAKVLRSTETSTLIYADPKEGRWGIGLPIGDPGVTERSAWKGENYLGQAWQAVRDGLPPLKEEEEEAQETETSMTGGYTEHGKTEGEAKEERIRVLQGHYRKMKKGM